MVKIDNIAKEGNLVSIDCYEEGDKTRSHHVVFDADTLEIKNQSEKNAYVRQSMWRIHTILKEGTEPPKATTSYWY